MNEQILFPLGGCATNSELKGFKLPNAACDGVIYNDGGGDVYFVDQPRFAFEYAGFPAWRSGLTKPIRSTPVGYIPEYAKIFPSLVRDLVPL